MLPVQRVHVQALALVRVKVQRQMRVRVQVQRQMPYEEQHEALHEVRSLNDVPPRRREPLQQPQLMRL